jgi:hypothetical protein
MKKFLLSIAALASFTGYAMADTVTLSATDAEEIQGTFVEEQLNDDGTLKQAPCYQPVESFEVSNFVFEFAKGNAKSNPALFLTPSTNTSTKPTIRVYGTASDDGAADGNTMTITAPDGVMMSKMVFSGSNGTANAAQAASVGEVSDVTASSMTWTYDEGTNSVTFTFIKNARFTSVVVTTGTASENPTPAGSSFNKVTSLESGKYVFAVNQDGTLKIGTPVAESYSYGRMSLVDATLDGDAIVTDETNAYDLTVADGKVTIVDTYGRYYGMDATHTTSFQCYNEVNDGCYFTYAFSGDNVTLTSTLNTDCIVCQTAGDESWYTNIAPAKAPETYNLPILYKLADQSAVVAIEADNAQAPVVYYNLQGQRVANPEAGLYIRVQGSKVEKVAIR